jgi:ABC-type sulfate transport system substrate-binding protein
VQASTAEQGNVLIAHTSSVQLGQESGNQKMLRSVPGNISEDNTDGIALFSQFTQRRGVDGISQGFVNGFLYVG